MTANDKKQWRDFAHTLGVITASALARHEMSRAAQDRGGSFVRRFEMQLLAAAAADAPVLPRSEVIAPGGGLGISFEEREDGIWVRLQLKGFAALHANANREARLVSANGAVDYAFRFTGTGGAVCVLADVPGVRAGLANLMVLVASDEEA